MMTELNTFWISVLPILKMVGLFALIYIPLELSFAAHQQGPWRERSFTDLLFMLGQAFLFTAPVNLALVMIHFRVKELPLHEIHAVLHSQPLWLQAIEVMLISDLCIYWFHRWSHSIPLLWRFHRVHHTAEKLDWLAAYREHPFDNLYTRVIENLPLLLWGFDTPYLAGFIAFRGFWALYIHSNVKVDLGPFFRCILGSPRLHHWHHAIDGGGRCNFANLSPLMDIIFGTYRHEEEMPKEYGIAEESPKGWWDQILHPLLPKGVWCWQRMITPLQMLIFAVLCALVFKFLS